MSVPNRSDCARISVIRSGPMIPSRNPGQFSTIVVSISCPPASRPSMSSGLRFARAAYRPAVSPAGPDPMMTTFWSAKVPLDHTREVLLRGEAHDRFLELTVLEQQDGGNPADLE